jgi:ABC-2 type transport system permease protein
MAVALEAPASPAVPPGRSRSRARVSKYAAVAAIALRQAASERAALLGRIGFYAVILFIFSRLWEVVGSRGALAEALPGAGARELLWYLAVTEWVMLSLPLVHLQIERDVRQGDLAYQLPRPISYLGARLAESAGDFALRASALAVAGAGLARWMSGGLPEDPRGLLLAIPLGVLAAWVGLCFHAAVGLCAVWLQDCSPVYWIWQKCAFLFGGLMLPLEVYPDWLREIALWTPFAALMHGPGRMVFGWQPELALWTAGKLLVWAVVASALLVWVYRRARTALDVNGG